MVSSQQNDVFWVFELITEEKLNCFNWVVTSINKIANEDISRLRKLTSNFEEFQNIKELAMNVSAYGNRRTGFLDIWLFKQELFNFVAECTNSSFFQVFAAFKLWNPFIGFGHLNFNDITIDCIDKYIIWKNKWQWHCLHKWCSFSQFIEHSWLRSFLKVL